jgi:hypothetical protein
MVIAASGCSGKASREGINALALNASNAALGPRLGLVATTGSNDRTDISRETRGRHRFSKPREGAGNRGFSQVAGISTGTAPRRSPQPDTAAATIDCLGGNQIDRLVVGAQERTRTSTAFTTGT